MEKPVVSKCKDCNRNPNNYPKTQVGTKDEMKDKTSMALKDPIKGGIFPAKFM